MGSKSSGSSGPVSKVDETKSFFSGWLDYIFENTANLSNLIQFGENEEAYSLSNDYKRLEKLHESMARRLKNRHTTSDSSDNLDGSASSDDNRVSRPVSRKTVDSTLYDRLELSPSATKNEIKSTYRKLALKYHPDKNDSAEAKKKFQEIGEAYRILVDDASRDRYDKVGLTNDMIMKDIDIDPSVLFMMFFGCDMLEEYIGTVKIESALRYSMNYTDGNMEGSFSSFNFNAFKQPSKSGALALHTDDVYTYINTVEEFRRVKLAVILRDRINEFLKFGKIPDSFNEFMENVCQETYVDLLVSSVGWVYENAAETYISETTSFLGLGATLSNLQSVGRNINNGYNIVKSSISALTVLSQSKLKDMDLSSMDVTKIANDRSKVSDLNDEEMMQTVQAFLECFMTLVIYDVESAVREACMKVCKDQDVDEKSRLKRAYVMKKMGVNMQAIAERVRNKHGKAKVDVYKILQQAYVRAKKMSDKDN